MEENVFGCFWETVKIKTNIACEWVKEHKVESILIIGGLFLVCIGGKWILKSRSGIKAPMPKVTSPTLNANASEAGVKLFTPKMEEVASHIRNLPEGQQASLLKILKAERMGIDLDGKTIVDAYTRLRAS